MSEESPTQGKLIGNVVHYYGHVGVAVIELNDSLNATDTIRIAGGTTDFTQSVDSMEVDHAKVDKAKPGDCVGLKVSQKVKEGYKVYKL